MPENSEAPDKKAPDSIKVDRHLYRRILKDGTPGRFFTVIAGKRHALGADEGAARRQLALMLGLAAPAHTIKSMCLAYLEHTRTLFANKARNSISARTLDDYTYALTRQIIPVFGDMRPEDFRPKHGAQYLAMARNPPDGREPFPVSANRYLAALSSAFVYGMEQGIVESNPCRGIRRNKERPRTDRPDVATFNDFMGYAQSRGGARWMCALIAAAVALSGRRRAELLLISRADIGEHGIRVMDCKTKSWESPRSYLIQWSPMMRTLVQLATEAGKANGATSIYLFPQKSGGPYTDEGFKSTWGRLMMEYRAYSGKRFRAHDLRSLYASEMLAANRDPKTHKNPKTTFEVYNRQLAVKVDPLA
jgi:integrase